MRHTTNVFHDKENILTLRGVLFEATRHYSADECGCYETSAKYTLFKRLS